MPDIDGAFALDARRKSMIRLMRTYIGGILLLLAFGTVPTIASSLPVSGPGESSVHADKGKFARDLYSSGYYSLAALEWARVLSSTEGNEADVAQLELAYSLWHIGDTRAAQKVLDDIVAATNRVIRLHAISLRSAIALANGDFEHAADYATNALQRAEDLPSGVATSLVKCVAARSLVRGDVSAALAILRDGGARSEELQESLRPSVEPDKVPWVAGTMSAVVPGLGQVYCGRWVDGAVALTVDGLLVGATIECYHKKMPVLGTALGVFGLGWYLGNIYNAVNEVHKGNDERRVRTVTRWLRSLDIRLDEDSLRAGFRLRF